MVVRVLGVVGNIVIKIVTLALYMSVDWVVIYPAAPHRDAGKIWLVVVVLGIIFTAIYMAMLTVCLRYALRTHAGSLILQPLVGLVIFAAVLWLAPQYIAIPGNSWFKFVFVGLVLSMVTLPIKSRKDRQIIAVTGPQPPE